MPKTDPLAAYNAKRDFAKTAEPAGTIPKGRGRRFIVQKHDATRLHWDFRIEIDGVLKSWAVTRGPSLDPADKRLAVRTEDHPMSYADFEGTIPKGEYGGGTVMLWDRGQWAPIAGKSAKDLDEGHLHFTLDGERMKGAWLLIRLKPRGKEKRENWLLRKIDDDAAGAGDTLVEGALTSVKTGRTMREIADNASPAIKSSGPGLRRGDAGMPRFVKPQLATLVDSAPVGSDWFHEVKYDGYRALVAVGGGKAKVFTRTGLDWTDRFPAIAEAAAALDVGQALIDGEIVALDKDGRPDFSRLQAEIKAGGAMTMFAFDLLKHDGADLTTLPNVQRKERLRAVLAHADGAIQFAEHVLGAGEKLFEAMCAAGYEGIVSKRADGLYHGKRTKNWVKTKCTQRQEFVIVGWTESNARTRGFASLLLALNADGVLRYAGKVGTGFSEEAIHALKRRFARIERKTPPVEVPKAAARNAHWLRPSLVAEIAFAEFTADNVVRHASFLGLREDKAANEVVPEAPAPAPAAPAYRITNRDRVIFPGDRLTKGDLADYYAEVAGLMLPWAANRPVSLVRCPQGRAKHCFFQKHDAGSFGEAVRKVAIREKKGGSEDYLYVDSAAGLLACVQMGTIEFHGWASSVATLERPDRMVFDLDPDEGLDFARVVAAAERVKTVLGELGLTSFPMLSGGKGVHVVVPLAPAADWETFTGFADRFARAMAADDPDRFTATMSKAKRKGRIFLDWLRNQRGSTAILPYAARARAGAPVAAPVSWGELRDVERADRWTIADAGELGERARGRSLRGWGVADQVLPEV